MQIVFVMLPVIYLVFLYFVYIIVFIFLDKTGSNGGLAKGVREREMMATMLVVKSQGHSHSFAGQRG